MFRARCVLFNGSFLDVFSIFSTLHRINAAYLIYRRVEGKLKEKIGPKPVMASTF